jgi:flagellar biosynthesis protein FlhF
VRVKTYRASTMAEALTEVKRDLGTEAVILQTRRLRQGGIMGMLATEIVEVTAAVDPDSSARSRPAVAVSSCERPRFEMVEEDAKLMAVHLELANMRKTLETALSAMKPVAPILMEKKDSPLWQWVGKNDIEPKAAEALLQGISNEYQFNADECQRRLRERLRSYFRKTEGIVIRPGQCKVMALVGPTGVGKTTTVAKLAANFALREKMSVALITSDTYRIAAVDQLKTYADLIGIPIEVVYTPQELKNALALHRDKQLILIDTAGRSPANQPQMAELETLLAVDANIEKQLVLSATTKFTECLDAVQRFQVSNPQKYLFTKIDEACNLGTVFSLMYHAPKVLSYITTGQNVPDDIELADADRLATLMLRGGI